MQSDMIRFEKVTKTFPTGTTALKDITFTVDAGEFVIVTGRSGAGKTTLLRLMIREYLPTEGDIYIGDQHLNELKPRDLPALRRGIGVVYQDFKILQDSTAKENVAIVMELLGQDQEEAESRAQELLSQVELADQAELFPRQLSGGELQRVAIARAMALKPGIIFADEPTGNLDEKTSMEIFLLLKKINEQGTTLLIATHDLPLLTSFHPRILHLKKGSLGKETS